jgi:hypothetical protein
MPDEKMLEDAKCDRPEKNEPTQSVVVERYIQLKGCIHG